MEVGPLVKSEVTFPFVLRFRAEKFSKRFFLPIQEVGGRGCIGGGEGLSVCVYAYMHVQACMHVCLCVCVCVCICMCMHVCTPA